jgi:hypothetical protein
MQVAVAQAKEEAADKASQGRLGLMSWTMNLFFLI